MIYFAVVTMAFCAFVLMRILARVASPRDPVADGIRDALLAREKAQREIEQSVGRAFLSR